MDLDGVYFPSFERSLVHNCYNLKTNFKVIGSAHNLFELNIKKKQKISEVFISPVFEKKGRKTRINACRFRAEFSTILNSWLR